MVLTRSASRARMRITRWLPNEVLTEIIRHARRADQMTLCRASKLFHALVLPILSQSIDLWTNRPSSLKEFCLSLVKNPERAVYTRSISIINDGACTFALDLLMQTMQLMGRIQKFCLNEGRTSDEQLTYTVASRLASLSFPHLTHLSAIQTNGNPSIAPLRDFLGRHPTITHLCMLDHDKDSDWSGIHLPNLRQYLGADKPDFLGALRLRPLHCLKEAKIMWSSWDIEPTLEPLGSMPVPHLPFVFSSNVIIWDTNHLSRTLASLSVHMPYMTSFQIRSWHTETMGLETIQRITAHLPAFTKLVYLALDYVQSEDLYVASAVQDEQALYTWTDVCPTLKACCLAIGATAWRKVGESGEMRWEIYPRADFEAEAGFVAFEEGA
ncbi:hypothetical protein FB45DRAFT_1065535 [Roridomyces roridus]|uniref:F-box domain-containing protein n=1 Tax=Roridomyces roridus TaxID=1738132 RepID=A0AAD7B789_9AGAR|nr:hypothetical protein FB45DRAFT_1065535 [Roridomyces roridus]